VVAAGYGSPALVSELLGGASSLGDHDAAFAATAQRLRALVPPGARSVLVAHAFVQGGVTSESERLLQVGGTGAVSAAHFAGFDYVALGHLHRRQAIDGGRVAYSGSPLAYSFSEAAQAKSLSLVELAAEGGATAEEIVITPRRASRRLRGTLAEVLAAADGPGREDWLQVTLTDRPYGAKAMLDERFASVLDLRFEASSDAPGIAATRDRSAADPLSLLEAFRASVGAPPLDAEEKRLAAKAIAAAERAEA